MAAPDKNLIQAIQAHQKGQLKDAESLYRKVLAKHPREGIALLNLGVIVFERGELDEAERLTRQAIQTNPKNTEAHNNMGNILRQQGKLDEAIAAYQQAIKVKPNEFAYNNMGNVLSSLGRFEDAVTCFQQALQVRPTYAEAYFNMGINQRALGRLDDSVASSEKALALRPQFPEALASLGISLTSLGRLEEAVARFRAAVALAPNFADAYNNMGIALVQMRDKPAAAEAYRAALRLRPGYPEASLNLATLLIEDGHRAEAVELFQQVLARDPENASAWSKLSFEMRQICDWRDFDAIAEKLRQLGRQGSERMTPFSLITLPCSAEDQLIYARNWVARIAADAPVLPPRQGRRRDRIRIGYLSADYHDHATAYLMAELFERHDRSRFEIYGYSIGPDSDSAIRRRLVAGFDAFADLQALSHPAAAQRIRDDEIDILVDLKGYTKNARTEIVACRPAPVQVNYIGYPGTMGAGFIDYIIADGFIIPPDQYRFFDEKVVALPHCYQPNDTTRVISDIRFTRAQCGLPEQGFVFCSFNGLYKITPQIFDIWMRLLDQVPGSVLWLLQTNEEAADNLRREARARGIAPERLVFAPYLMLPDHLARSQLADLFLDNLPVNAHTTASDALWAGLPVLTCAGDTFISRVAGSILTAIGLPELITTNLQDYEALALQLARDPARVAALKQTIRDRRMTSPLFDIARLTRNLEQAYAQMWERHLSGQPPEAFRVIDDTPVATPVATPMATPAAVPAPAAPPAAIAAPVPAPAAPATHLPFGACPLCGGSARQVLRSVPCSSHPAYTPDLPAQIIWCRCDACGHVHADGHLAPAALSQVLARRRQAVLAAPQPAETLRQLCAPTVEALARFAPPGEPAGEWLEAEPGDGGLLLTAQEWGYRPVAFDAGGTAQALSQMLARRGVALLPGTVPGALESLPGEGRFTVISLAEILPMLPDPVAALKAAHRLLRPKGALLLTMANGGSFAWAALDEAGQNPYWREFHTCHIFSRERLHGLLRDCGFTPAHYAIGPRYRLNMEVIATKS